MGINVVYQADYDADKERVVFMPDMKVGEVGEIVENNNLYIGKYVIKTMVGYLMPHSLDGWSDPPRNAKVRLFKPNEAVHITISG